MRTCNLVLCGLFGFAWRFRDSSLQQLRDRHACKKGGGKDIRGHSRTFLTTSVCEDGGLARNCAVDHDRFRVRVHGDEALLAHVLLSRGQSASGFLQ